MHIVVTMKDDQGNVVAEILATQKQFKTGSRGFYGMTKVEIEGKRYQTQIQLVEIGSKDTPASDAPAS